MGMRGAGAGMGLAGPWCPLQNDQIASRPAVRPWWPGAGQRQAPAIGRGGGVFEPGRGMGVPGRGAGLGLGAGVPMGRCMQWLDLTAEQQAKIGDILKEAVQERAEARKKVLEAVKEVLTEEQLEKLEDLQSRRPLPAGLRPGIGRGQGLRGQALAQAIGRGQGRGRLDNLPAPAPRQGRGRGTGRGAGLRR